MNTWDVLGGLAGELPGVNQLAAGVARNTVQRLLGFWCFWHMFGGVSGIIEAGAGSTSSAYRQQREFRAIFGMEVEDFAPDLGEQIYRMSRPGRG